MRSTADDDRVEVTAGTQPTDGGSAARVEPVSARPPHSTGPRSVLNVALRAGRTFVHVFKAATIDANSSEAGATFGILLALAVWLIAARIFDAEALGVGAALASATVMTGLVCRLLVTSWTRGGGNRLTVYAATGALALLLGTVVAYGAQVVAPSLASTLDSVWRLTWFALAAAAAAWFLLARDAVARNSGLRGIVVIDAALAAGVVALSVLAGGGDGWTILVAWSAPLVVVAALVTIVSGSWPLTANGMAPDEPAAPSAPRVNEVDFGALAVAAAVGMMPLLVLGAAGPAAAATYYLAALVAVLVGVLGRSASLDQLPGRLGMEEADGAIAPAEALVRTLVLLVPFVALVFLFAPQITAAFALDHLPEAASLLRLLVAASIPATVVGLAATVFRLRGRLVLAGAVEAVVPVAMLILAAPLLGTWGAQGIAAAWLAGYTAAAIGLGTAMIMTGGRGTMVGWLLALATAGARVVAAATLAERMAPRARADADSVRELLATSADPQAALWRPLGALPSRGDVLIDFLGHEIESAAPATAFEVPPGTKAFLKRGVTAEGMRALERQRVNLAMLRNEPRLTDCGIEFPEIVAFRRTDDAVWSVERSIKGVDGRIALQDPLRRSAAVAAAYAAIDEIHRRTATPLTIDEAWLDRWIDRPAALLQLPSHTLLSRRARSASIDAFRRRQHAYWLGRRVPVGIYHGDYSPGNVLFEDGTSEVVVNGILDWDRAGRDGPPGYDTCHFALAARRVLGGEQIGEIVRELLISPDPWGIGPPTSGLPLFPQYGCDVQGFDKAGDLEAIRALVGLTWLRLVSANIEKSHKFTTNRLWVAANLDRVLDLF